MATKQPEGRHSFASIMLIIILFGSIAVMAFVPVKAFDEARKAEQEQIIQWLGSDSDQWIMSRIVDALQDVNKITEKNIDRATISGNGKIDSWIVQRLYAISIWLNLILYRIGMIGMWCVFVIPCMAASIIDGYYQRQIAKATFKSQSPILHQSGVKIAHAVVALVLLWMFVPIHVPTVVAPVFIAVFSFAGWVWMTNLQKTSLYL